MKELQHLNTCNLHRYFFSYDEKVPSAQFMKNINFEIRTKRMSIYTALWTTCRKLFTG